MLRWCLRLRRRLRRRCLELLRRPLWLRLRHLPLDCCGLLLHSLLLLLRDKIRVLPRLLRFYLPLLLLSLPLLQPPLLDHVAHAQILLPVTLLHLLDLPLLLDLDRAHNLLVVHIALLVVKLPARTAQLGTAALAASAGIRRRLRRRRLRRWLLL